MDSTNVELMECSDFAVGSCGVTTGKILFSLPSICIKTAQIKFYTRNFVKKSLIVGLELWISFQKDY